MPKMYVHIFFPGGFRAEIFVNMLSPHLSFPFPICIFHTLSHFLLDSIYNKNSEQYLLFRTGEDPEIRERILGHK